MGCLPLLNSSSSRRHSSSRSLGSHSSDNIPTSPSHNSIQQDKTEPTDTSIDLPIKVDTPELVVVSVNENAGASFEAKINAQCYAMLIGAIEPNIEQQKCIVEDKDDNRAIKRQHKSLFNVRKDKERIA